LSTILLFWAAIIRATRQWGGDSNQGSAFGILDGGRGLLAALIASVMVAVFSALIPGEIEQASLGDKRQALSVIIWIFTGITTIAALLVYLCVPDEEEGAVDHSSERGRLQVDQILEVLKNPAVWLQGLIIVTAYTGYKGMDDLSLLARDTYGMNDIEAAQVSTLSFWIRPFAALGAGLLGDRLGGVRTIIICFTLVIIGDLVIALGFLDPSAPWILFMSVVITGVSVFGLRGLYFAIFNDAGVPAALTGTAVGLVSVIGYTPDIFIGPINGYLTDTYPGALGHQYFFGVLAVFATMGLMSALGFASIVRRRQA
jgi:nitrate/nitrite transporter NarK